MRYLQILAALLTLTLQGTALAHIPPYTADVTVEITTDDGRALPVYPKEHGDRNSYRAYLEAVNGKNYRIKIHNRSHKRIGLVIAVDGRNIISGGKSNLQPSEQMYILGPYERGTFNGWRTSTEAIHRFYFTRAGASYAGAWGDYSAMGVIAVAVFPEKSHYRPYSRERRMNSEGGRSEEAPRAPAQVLEKSAGIQEDSASQPGTGFGERQYSHVRLVHFDPVASASARYFFKYEWHESLCKKGIIDCGMRTPNRFWPEDGQFAPYPPG